MKLKSTRTLLLLSALLLAIILPFLFFGAAVEAWTGALLRQAHARPLATAALLTALLASDILLPVPSSLASTACGMTLGLAAGTAASFLGMSLSTAAGYAIGRWCSGAAGRLLGPAERQRVADFEARHGLWMLLALRPVPVLAEASVLFSGLSRQPWPRVAAVTAAGNLAVSLAYAAVGSMGRTSATVLPAFGASLLLAGLFAAGLKRRRPTRAENTR